MVEPGGVDRFDEGRVSPAADRSEFINRLRSHVKDIADPNSDTTWDRNAFAVPALGVDSKMTETFHPAIYLTDQDMAEVGSLAIDSTLATIEKLAEETRSEDYSGRTYSRYIESDGGLGLAHALLLDAWEGVKEERIQHLDLESVQIQLGKIIVATEPMVLDLENKNLSEYAFRMRQSAYKLLSELTNSEGLS